MAFLQLGFKAANPKYQCMPCGKKFKHKIDWKKHTLSEHAHKVKKLKKSQKDDDKSVQQNRNKK